MKLIFPLKYIDQFSLHRLVFFRVSVGHLKAAVEALLYSYSVLYMCLE